MFCLVSWTFYLNFLDLEGIVSNFKYLTASRYYADHMAFLKLDLLCYFLPCRIQLFSIPSFLKFALKNRKSNKFIFIFLRNKLSVIFTFREIEKMSLSFISVLWNLLEVLYLRICSLANFAYSVPKLGPLDYCSLEFFQPPFLAMNLSLKDIF